MSPYFSTDDHCPVCGRPFEVGEEVALVATVGEDHQLLPTKIAMHRECAKTALPDALEVETDPGPVQ